MISMKYFKQFKIKINYFAKSARPISKFKDYIYNYLSLYRISPNNDVWKPAAIVHYVPKNNNIEKVKFYGIKFEGDDSKFYYFSDLLKEAI